MQTKEWLDHYFYDLVDGYIAKCKKDHRGPDICELFRQVKHYEDGWIKLAEPYRLPELFAVKNKSKQFIEDFVKAKVRHTNRWIKIYNAKLMQLHGRPLSAVFDMIADELIKKRDQFFAEHPFPPYKRPGSLNLKMDQRWIDVVLAYAHYYICRLESHYPRMELAKINPGFLKVFEFYCQHSILPGQVKAFLKYPDETKRPRISVKEANIRAREIYKKDSDWHIKARDLAEKIPCSVGLIPKLPIWKAVQEKLEQERIKKGRKAKKVGLTNKILTITGTGKKDQVLNKLILEQEADTQEDGRQAKLFLSNQEKPLTHD